MHLLPAQVDPPVAEPQRLVDALLVQLERERRSGREHPQRVDLELDLTRRQVRVRGLGRADDDLAFCLEHVLVSDPVCLLRRLGRALGVDDELADPGLVAEIDEDQAAVVAAAGDPAGERVALADMIGADFARAEVPPAHAESLSASSSSGTSMSCVPGVRMMAAVGPTTTVVRAPRRPAWVSWPFSERPA